MNPQTIKLVFNKNFTFDIPYLVIFDFAKTSNYFNSISELLKDEQIINIDFDPNIGIDINIDIVNTIISYLSQKSPKLSLIADAYQLIYTFLYLDYLGVDQSNKSFSLIGQVLMEEIRREYNWINIYKIMKTYDCFKLYIIQLNILLINGKLKINKIEDCNIFDNKIIFEMNNKICEQNSSLAYYRKFKQEVDLQNLESGKYYF
jgi:hypothetical protein